MPPPSKGFKVWRRTSPAKRAEIILKAVGIMRQRVEEMAVAMTLEQGKPIAQSRLEILRGCEIIEWDAQEGRRTYGRVIPSEPGMRHTVLRQPIGPVAAFSPWNFPMSSPSRKVGGALSAGCSIILKASEETPAGAVQLARAFTDAGLPPGVLNLVFGEPAEDLRLPDPAAERSGWSRSPARSRSASSWPRWPAQHMKPAIMELGGHAPVIVCDDVDPVATAATSVMGKSRNAGQVCVSPTRLFVQETIYERVRRGLRREGRGRSRSATAWTPTTRWARSPTTAASRPWTATGGRRQGQGRARCWPAAQRLGNRGYFFPLTVLADVPDDARVMREEPFGPLALVNPVKHLDEAIANANALPYGLAAYAFTNSASNADGWPRAWRPATCRSTTSSPRSPRRRSAASRTAATAARAAPRGCRTTRW